MPDKGKLSCKQRGTMGTFFLSSDENVLPCERSHEMRIPPWGAVPPLSESSMTDSLPECCSE